MGAGEREEGEEPAIQAMFTYVRGKTKFENKSSLQCSVIWPTLKNNNLQQQQWKLILANVSSGPSAQYICQQLFQIIPDTQISRILHCHWVSKSLGWNGILGVSVL